MARKNTILQLEDIKKLNIYLLILHWLSFWFQCCYVTKHVKTCENPSGESNIVWKAKEFNIFSTQHCWGVLSKFQVVLDFIKNVSINTEYICNVIALRYKFDIKWNSVLMTIRWHLLDISQINFIIARVNPYFNKNYGMHLVASAASFLVTITIITINIKMSELCLKLLWHNIFSIYYYCF